MLFSEKSNEYSRKLLFETTSLSKDEMFVVREFGEYRTKELNIRNLNRFEFKGYMLMMVLEGTGAVKIDNVVYSLSIGDLILFNSNVSQLISNNRWRVIYLNLEGSFLHKVISKNFGNRILFHFKDIQHIYTLFNSIYQSLEIDTYTGRMKTNSYIFRLLADIENYDTIKNIEKTFEDKILNYIEENLCRDISIEDMAEFCGYSKYGFIREFKKSFEDTPHNYLCSRRIAFAKELLSLTSMTIEEVSFAVGFNSVSNFCVAFKRKENMTSREYQKYKRKMIRGGSQYEN